MAEAPKRLGSLSGSTAVTTLVDNTATASAYTIFSAIVFCNTDTVDRTFTMSTSGTAATHGTYIASASVIRPNDTVTFDKIILDNNVTTGARYLIVTVSAGAVHVSAFGVQGP